MQIQSGDRADCKTCHWDKPSHIEVIRRGFRPADADQLYKTPIDVAVSPDGSSLYVVCQNSDSLLRLGLATRTIVAEVRVGRRPQAVALSGDGRFAYVTNRMDGTLSVVDVGEMTLVREMSVGHEPHGVAVDRATGNVLVANTGDNTLAIVSPEKLSVLRRLVTSDGPWSVDVDDQSRRAYVTNVRPRLGNFRDPPVSEVTVVDLNKEKVIARPDVSEANMLQGISQGDEGGPALFALMRTKNLIPTSRVAQGWVITNGVGVLWPDGRVDQVLLDEPAHFLPDIFDVAVSPDGATAIAVSGGANEVAIIDVPKLLDIIRNTPSAERSELLPNHLGAAVPAIKKRVPVGINPRAVAFSPDSRFAYVSNALDDTVSIIRLDSNSISGTIALGGPMELTKLRKGDRLFHDAGITFGRQFSCRSCHPDGHLNGLTFDIEADGAGMNPVDNRTLEGIYDTPPFKWEGTNPSLHRQCGPRLAVFFTRLQPYTPDELDALVHYMATIERPPNRHRDPQGLTLAQRRGKEIFQRKVRNDGTVIPLQDRCNHCHAGAYRTNREINMVATTMWFDAFVNVDVSANLYNTDDFGELGSYYFVDVGLKPKVLDVPHLTNITDGAPYLHNGAANTLEEIWTRFNMTDKHGATADLTRQQFNDLIAYLKAQ